MEPWEIDNLRRSNATLPLGRSAGALTPDAALSLVDEVLTSKQETGTLPTAVAELRRVLEALGAAEMEPGHTEATASGRPVSPSQTRMHTSLVPRFLISVSTCAQYFAPSPPSPTHKPKMSRVPSTVTPMAT